MARSTMSWLLLLLCHVMVNYIEPCKKLDQYCYCDETCATYGDCCPGHSNYNQTALLSNISSCKPVSATLSVQIIDTCAVIDHKLADLCKKVNIVPEIQLKSQIPVLTDNGVLYENVFCALCNDEKRFQFLNMTVNCVDNEPNSVEDVNLLLQNNSECSLITVFPDNHIRRCFNKLIRTCPNDFNDTVEGTIANCENVITNNTTLFTDGDMYYRNKFCCNCWNRTCFPFGVSRGISISGFSYMLNFNEWLKENNKLRNNETSPSVEIDPFHYVCLLFAILSIISLVVLLSIYLSQNIFHSFGGYLTICLGTCLLVLHVLTILPAKIVIATSFMCKSIAIAKHFISLSVFLWMSIYAVDLMQTFGFQSTGRNQRKTFKTFLIYCVTGFGLVTVIVTSATIVDYTASANSTFRSDYGGRYCWFTSKFGGLIWYFLPVCTLLTWNFVASIVVFYRLQKTVNECRIVQANETTNTLWLCIRLTAVFGIGYAFQILAILSTVDVLIVLGSLVNCLQGFLVAICFLWAKRVRTVVSKSVTSMSILRSQKRSSAPNPRTMVTLLSVDNERRISSKLLDEK